MEKFKIHFEIVLGYSGFVLYRAGTGNSLRIAEDGSVTKDGRVSANATAIAAETTAMARILLSRMLRRRSLRRSSTTANFSFSTSSVQILRPGLVVIRSALSEEEQLDLTKISVQLGQRTAPQGFFDENGAPNSRDYRGRIFSSIKDWPTWVKDNVCNRAVTQAREVEATLSTMSPTHVLLLCYMNAEGVGWHRDIYENDGQGESPIVTVNLGNSCDFIFKDDHLSPKTFVTLESGDVLLFGGPQRYAMHKVSHVHEDTCPSHLASELSSILETAKAQQPQSNSIGSTARLSLTFRDAPTVIGREAEFATFKVDEHFDKDANFSWRKEKGQVGAQPGQNGVEKNLKE